MNILIRELKANLKSLIIWCLSMAFLIYAGMVKYSAYAKTGEAVNEFMAQIPLAMKDIMGIGSGDLTSVMVFYSIFFMYFMLLAAVHSSMLGVIIVAKEERDKTADFLYVKPIRRQYAVSFKILAALINIIIFNLVTFVISVLSVRQYDSDTAIVSQIFMAMAALFILQLLFLGLGLLLGAAVRKSKAGTSIASSIILAAFMVKVLIDLNKDLDKLTFLTPFKYFNANTVMFDKQIDTGFAILSILLAAACTAGSYYFFKKRDLHS